MTGKFQFAQSNLVFYSLNPFYHHRIVVSRAFSGLEVFQKAPFFFPLVLVSWSRLKTFTWIYLSSPIIHPTHRFFSRNIKTFEYWPMISPPSFHRFTVFSVYVPLNWFRIGFRRFCISWRKWRVLPSSHSVAQFSLLYSEEIEKQATMYRWNSVCFILLFGPSRHFNEWFRVDSRRLLFSPSFLLQWVIQSSSS